MMATSTELLRMVSSLDSVDFSSIKSFISQPFRYSPVFCSFGLSSECNMYEGIVSKKNLETRGFNRPFCSSGLIVLALVMSEREVEVNLVLIQTSCFF